MLDTRIIIAASIVSLMTACFENQADETEAQTEELAIVNQALSQPRIRHSNYDGSEDISGTKLMEPETLNNVITNLLGEELDINGNNPIGFDFSDAQSNAAPRYPVYLGGLNYEPISQRTKAVSATMPLVIDRIAKAVCVQGIGNGKFNINTSGGSKENVADTLHRRLCSRPIDSDTQTNVDNILAVDDTNDGWQAVCVYFLLKQGSFLVN